MNHGVQRFADGHVSDGRPYRNETWCRDQATFLTFFISVDGLETADKEELLGLVVSEGRLIFSTAVPIPMPGIAHRCTAGDHPFASRYGTGGFTIIGDILVSLVVFALDPYD